MKICEGLILDPKTFNEQSRGLRHVRPMREGGWDQAMVVKAEKLLKDTRAEAVKLLKKAFPKDRVELSINRESVYVKPADKMDHSWMISIKPSEDTTARNYNKPVAVGVEYFVRAVHGYPKTHNVSVKKVADLKPVVAHLVKLQKKMAAS